MKPRFDVHCHLFNKTFLSRELYFRLTAEIRRFLGTEEERERALAREVVTRESKVKGFINGIRRFIHFLHAGLKDNSTEVYRELLEVYGDEPFIITPLMFDLTWCFVGSAEGTRDLGGEDQLIRIFEETRDELLRKMDEVLPAKKRKKAAERALSEEDAMLAELEGLKKEFKELTGKLEKVRHEEETQRRELTRDLFGRPTAKDGYLEQIHQLRELKAIPEYHDRVFPFLSVDPRRPGILEDVLNFVGKGKEFAGVKIYSPNGYSPTDPVLFGHGNEKGGVFRYCEENGIPVTAHNSFGGFATFVSKVRVTGFVYDKNLRKPVYRDNEWISFEKPITKFTDAIKERALALNHPSLWEKVLEKYPNLYLNLAHFGGGDELKKAIEDPGDNTLWSNRIIGLITRYDHAFTDLSCYSEFDVIGMLREKNYLGNPLLKSKILFGTDFYLLLLFDTDYKFHIDHFKEQLSSDFDVISRENPLMFLKNVLPGEIIS
jgi:predicted TIM-barrel fold metal-dependent hydrolase